jgi:hypothetical protein
MKTFRNRINSFNAPKMTQNEPKIIFFLKKYFYDRKSIKFHCFVLYIKCIFYFFIYLMLNAQQNYYKNKKNYKKPLLKIMSNNI